MKNITIIGGGNLGLAIAEGILASEIVAPNNITITRRNIEKLAHLQSKGVHTSSNNAMAVAQADYIVLAVKPFQIQQIMEDLKPHLDSKRQVLISVITGISLKDLEGFTDASFSIIRAMPNTAIAIRESMTCICGQNNKKEDLDFIKNIFDQLGKSIIIDEQLMDAATVLGACGTAFAMRYIRACIQGGIEIGFDAKTAALIAAQTAKGASELLLTQNTHPEQEIDKVTTPKGCTIAGLNEMEHRGFSSSLIKGIATSYYKIKNDM